MEERKLPIKTRRFILTGEYDGWWCDVRVNAPLGIMIDRLSELQKADVNNPIEVAPPLYNLLEIMITNWNFVDEQGNPLPIGIGGFKQLPLDLLLLISQKAQEESLSIPLPQSGS